MFTFYRLGAEQHKRLNYCLREGFDYIPQQLDMIFNLYDSFYGCYVKSMTAIARAWRMLGTVNRSKSLLCSVIRNSNNKSQIVGRLTGVNYYN